MAIQASFYVNSFLITRGADTQIHMHTDVRTISILRNQVRASLWPACTWFKKPILKMYTDLFHKTLNYTQYMYMRTYTVLLKSTRDGMVIELTEGMLRML